MAPVHPLGVNCFCRVPRRRLPGFPQVSTWRPTVHGRAGGYTIVCPCHDWRFDVRTGKFLGAPELGLTVYPTEPEAGKLLSLEGKDMA